MTPGRAAIAAAPPPAGLPGLDPAWSRLVEAPAADGDRTWHLLDTGPALEAAGTVPVGTLLCVHGNPTWSYLWRDLARASVEAPPGAAWRVVAVDQLEMGFSERTGRARTLAERVRDLGALTDVLGLAGPVVTVGHDWGGIVSLGWAVDHPELLAGVVVTNTAVHQPADAPRPAPLRLVLAPGVTAAGTSLTTGFLDVTLGIAHPPLAPEIRAAFRSPYRERARRLGIEAFVRDIPFADGHPSRPELDRVAAGVAALRVPALILWGPRDPVFSAHHLADLMARLPHADVHRFEGAGHLLPMDADVTGAIRAWLRAHESAWQPHEADGARHVRERATAGSGSHRAVPEADPWAGLEPLWGALDARADDDGLALAELAAPGGRPHRVSWRLLATRVRELAAGLVGLGVRPGDRVSLLVPPGADLTAILYAALRIGAVAVVADAGLGLAGLTRAVRGARPDWVIGVPVALAAARALGWPGARISVPTLPAAARRALGVRSSVAELVRSGRERLASGAALPTPPGPDDLAAVLFTSGSTGPAKGVRYAHRGLAGARDALRSQYGIGPGSGMVAGFAPFALLGPALGCRIAAPAMDVTRPSTLGAGALADAVEAIDADLVFLSPAALTNVAATAAEAPAHAFDRIRVLLSAGAPVGEPLLERAAAVLPHASLHTPYGMTECLLVTDTTLDALRAAGAGSGILVGRPAAGAAVRIAPLDADGRATGHPTEAPETTGEVLISAPHLLQGYDRLWVTDAAARLGPAADRWHRTGDVGHLDASGALWIEGRLPHVVTTADGVVTPVGPEQRIQRVVGVRRAAVVGVGPRGTQQVVAVVETGDRPGLAEPGLADAVRAAAGVPVAAVLAVPALPVDIRHQSKIDRSALARWATGVLAGGRVRAPELRR